MAYIGLAVNSRYNINSLARGLAVLQAIGASEQGLTVSDVTKLLKTNNATASRLCYTLMSSGFVGRDGNKRYHVTSKVLSLGFGYFSALPKHTLVLQSLEELSDELKATASLSILDGTDIVYLMRIAKRHYLPFDVRVGSRFPAYCSSMGRVLLAFARPRVAQDVLARSRLTALTPHTITSVQELTQQLRRIKRAGYAVNDEESALGNRAVAAPILDGQGVATAAINVALPCTECTRTELEEVIAPRLIDAAGKISRALQMFADPFRTDATSFIGLYS